MPNQFVIDININGSSPPSQSKIQSGVKEVNKNNNTSAGALALAGASIINPKTLNKTWSATTTGLSKNFENQLTPHVSNYVSDFIGLKGLDATAKAEKQTQLLNTLRENIMKTKPYSRPIDRILGGNRMWRNYVKNSNDLTSTTKYLQNLDTINENLKNRLGSLKSAGLKTGAAAASAAATFVISNMGTFTNDEAFTANMNTALGLAGSIGLLATNPVLGGISLALTTANKAYQYAANLNKELNASQRNIERLGLVRAKGGR